MEKVPYLSAVGTLQYLATTTCPDISYTVCILAHFNCNPGLEHWKAVKHLFHYLKGSLDYKLVYSPIDSSELFITYTDADHGGNPDNGCSTGGYAIIMGGAAVSWSSRLQPVVSLSTTEAEYIAAVEAGKKIIWMRNLLSEFGFTITSPSTLLIDNNSAVTVAKNPEHHSRMKHLNLRYHWLRDTVEAKFISPIHVPTTSQAADILTKPLKRQKMLLFLLFHTLFILSLTLICDALITSMFAIIYIYPYRTQSPIIALFSCLHWTLGIVLVLFT